MHTCTSCVLAAAKIRTSIAVWCLAGTRPDVLRRVSDVWAHPLKHCWQLLFLYPFEFHRPMVLVTAAVDTGQTSPEANKKKTRLETSNVKDAGLRRLVEYFVVVSSVPNAKCEGAADIQESVSFEGSRDGLAIDDDEDIYIDDFDFQPKITARFPLQDHQENPLHESVTFFCYPSGSIQLRMEKSMPKVGYFARRTSLADLSPLQRPTSHESAFSARIGITPRRVYATVGS